MIHVKGFPVDSELFTELREQGIIVEYRCRESRDPYYGLKPRYRREIYQLGEPQGFTLEYMESQKMTTENQAREGQENAPRGAENQNTDNDALEVTDK